MKPILRTERLDPSELQALFGEEKDYSCSLNDIVDHTETDGQNIAVCDLTLSDADNGKQCSANHLLRPEFSNQEYYIKLEELKREHLRNMAELGKLYLSHTRPGETERQISTLWRHSRDTESELVELIQVGSKVSVGSLKNGVLHPNYKISLEEHRKLFQSSNSAANQLMDNRRRNSKVTIPKPFRMMLREEDRKQRKVKTRSEIELENDRLKKELDELKECGKRFRAKPAPATTHIPLNEIINQRPNKLQQHKYRSNQKHQGHHESNQQAIQRHSTPLPFSFIERERKKREKKLVDELNSLTPRAERKMFKARPVPRSLYRSTSPNAHSYGVKNLDHRCTTLPPSILEDTLEEEEDYDDEFTGSQSPDIVCRSSNLKNWKNKSLLQVEKEMERKNREREREWSYIHPLRRTSFCQEPLNTCSV